MKKYIHFLFASLALTTSCLKKDLEELPTFDENNITGVTKVEYRYISNKKSANDQYLVKNQELIIDSFDINSENKSVTIEVTVPPHDDFNFIEQERNKVSLDKLWVVVTIFNAARIFPMDNAPKLGSPGDWSKPNKYRVEAANGNVAEWTIHITKFNK